jgi:GH35 family endo-1,4-beta-xylanase
MLCYPVNGYEASSSVTSYKTKIPTNMIMKNIPQQLAVLALGATVACSAFAQTIRTDIGDGADTFINGGSKSADGAGGAGIVLMKEIPQANFKRLGVIRFDLKGMKAAVESPTITLALQKTEGASKLLVYGIRDSSAGDKRPSEGGWIEGADKKGVASDPAVLTWDRLADLLQVDLMPTPIVSPDVELLATIDVEGSQSLVIDGKALAEFIKKDSNQLVSFILAADSGSVIAKSKEWNKFQAPTLDFGGAPANANQSAAPATNVSFDFVPTDVSQLGEYEKSLVAEFSKYPSARFVAGTNQDEILKRIRVGGKTTSELVPVAGETFSQALRVVSEKELPKAHNALMTMTNLEPIKKGDSLLIVYNYRTLQSTEESGRGAGRFWFIPLGWSGGYSGFQDFGTSSDEWQRGLLAATAHKDFAPGKAQFDFHLGGKDGTTMEFGGISIINYGKAVTKAELPKNEFKITNYEGRQGEAQWRTDAQARIEEVRKADLKVQVVDTSGKPVEGAQVSVNMTQHAFSWGGAFGVHQFTDSADVNFEFSDALRQQYQDYITSGMFNSVTIENGLKWGPWIGQSGMHKQQWTLDGLQWLNENDLRVYGHTMHWGMRKFPNNMGFEANSPAGRQAVLDHIAEIGAATKDTVRYWDVVNEHTGYHDSTDWFGDEFMLEIFEAADQATDGAELYFNDNNVLTPGQSRNYDTVVKWLDYLTENNSPIDGVGFQSHFWADNLTEPESVYEKLEFFSKYGLDIQITEFDIGIADPKDAAQLVAQADFTRDFLTVGFSHPAVVGVTHWSPVYPAWRQDRQMTKKDFSLYPQGDMWKQLVTEAWWTREKGTTGANGDYATRGFLGSYEVTVTKGDQSTTQTVELTKEGETLTITLKL